VVLNPTFGGSSEFSSTCNGNWTCSLPMETGSQSLAQHSEVRVPVLAAAAPPPRRLCFSPSPVLPPSLRPTDPALPSRHEGVRAASAPVSVALAASSPLLAIASSPYHGLQFLLLLGNCPTRSVLLSFLFLAFCFSFFLR